MKNFHEHLFDAGLVIIQALEGIIPWLEIKVP
jgi:hypothetical protein